MRQEKTHLQEIAALISDGKVSENNQRSLSHHYHAFLRAGLHDTQEYTQVISAITNLFSKPADKAAALHSAIFYTDLSKKETNRILKPVLVENWSKAIDDIKNPDEKMEIIQHQLEMRNTGEINHLVAEKLLAMDDQKSNQEKYISSLKRVGIVTGTDHGDILSRAAEKCLHLADHAKKPKDRVSAASAALILGRDNKETRVKSIDKLLETVKTSDDCFFNAKELVEAIPCSDPALPQTKQLVTTWFSNLENSKTSVFYKLHNANEGARHLQKLGLDNTMAIDMVIAEVEKIHDENDDFRIVQTALNISKNDKKQNEQLQDILLRGIAKAKNLENKAEGAIILACHCEPQSEIDKQTANLWLETVTSNDNREKRYQANDVFSYSLPENGALYQAAKKMLEDLDGNSPKAFAEFLANFSAEPQKQKISAPQPNDPR